MLTTRKLHQRVRLGIVNLKGGGGGGSSGKVDYPEYMKEAQADWLGGGDPDGTGMATLTAGNDITTLLDTVIGNSPYATANAFVPDSRISTQESAYSAMATAADLAIQDYDDYLDSLSTTSKVETELAAFDAGMDNVNAVHSSSFAVGRQVVASGLIELKAQGKSQVAKFKLEKENRLATLTIEVQRMATVALKEEMDKNIKIDERDALWDLDAFQQGSNVLASIGGGTVSKTDSPSDLQSALAGGLSGAASGAMIAAQTGMVAGPIGAGIGAAIGIGASLLG